MPIDRDAQQKAIDQMNNAIWNLMLGMSRAARERMLDDLRKRVALLEASLLVDELGDEIDGLQ